MDVHNTILAPLETVNSLYNKAGCPRADAQDWGVKSYYQELVAQSEHLDKIPFVTAENADYLPNSSLVRFRGVVQDLLNPEYYVGIAKRNGEVITTKYSDPFDLEIDQDNHGCIWERKPILCRPVPGESAWCLPVPDIHLQQPHEEGCRHGKRVREADDVQDNDVCMNDTRGEAGKNPNISKATALANGADPNSNDVTRKDGCLPAAAIQDSGRSCLVFMYDNAPESVRLQDIVEAVGVLSKVPEMASFHFQDDNLDPAASMDDLATLQPSSKVMRVHALLITSTRALQPPPTHTPSLGPALLDATKIDTLRKHAMTWLARALGGDRLAAEYVLLQLLSKVTHRDGAQTGTDKSLGVLPLNISKCPADLDTAIADNSGTSMSQTSCSRFARCLRLAICALLPSCAALPLTTSSLNRGAWCPVRDATSGQLVPGWLQIGRGTPLLLDETLPSGADKGMTQQGLTNFQDLLQLADAQRLHYYFPFFTSAVPACTPLIALSTRPSLLSRALTMQVPLQPVNQFVGDESVWSEAARSTDPEWQEVRAYLDTVRSLPYTIPADMSAHLEAHFVHERQQDPGFNTDSFHTQLTLARLLCLSYGESTLTRARWDYVMSLEHKRQGRVRLV